MSRLVIDSSVAVKWFVPEVGSDIADRVLDRYKNKALTLLVPDLFFAEIGNIVWKKCRFQGLDLDDGQAIIYAIRLISFETTPTSQLLTDAYRLATDHERTVYDSLYLALSRSAGAPFLTADEKLFNALCQAMPNVFLLDDWRRLKAELDRAGDRDDLGRSSGPK